MTQYTYYHNSRCSKSRDGLELLAQHNIEPEVVNYLDTPPTAIEIKTLLDKLGMSARELMRTGEEAYKNLGLDNPGLTEEQLVDAMVREPILIQRPVFTNEKRAVIGRPTEKLLEILP
ncbi:arsenate reductase (glutaredoxin) [Thiopseudomonas denitrificans]|uniref:Arsenate reductase n=1 Tax=Thiopseudomonas denitrificans TaxID=1501432 RepID=A0A4R6U259_9GAMM|nr:arsenate reductase (glutaredoxin) [Thiopseudomonas denitrificans]TDQ38445.1 arsenate reductase [Thiopseudomonas denitrificans]